MRRAEILGTSVVIGAMAAAFIVRPVSVTAAQDPVKLSQKCRGTIAAQSATLVKTVLKIIDGCHGLRDKGKFNGDCNAVASADTKEKYASTEAKATEKIDKACGAGDPVRDNYPPDGDVEAVTFPTLLEDVEDSAAALRGSPDLGGDKAKLKCHKAVVKAESDIINEIVKNATKCQKAADKLATSFGELQGDCVATPAKSGPKATAAIPKACGTLGGPDVGSCAPLPQCLVTAATTTGQAIATAIYGKPVVCGNGIIEAGETCDDGNTIATDACTDVCHVAVCGDGIVHEGVEQCDQQSNGCIDCQIVFTCGNGVVEVPGEECDDGNAIAGDGCTNCEVDPAICGNGKIENGETCDDGNTQDGDACPSTCVIASCTPTATTRIVNVTFAGSSDVAGITIYLEYPEGKVSLPGTSSDASVQERISGAPASSLVQANDLDYALILGIVKTSAFPAGPLFTATFDACTSAAAPTNAELPCTVTEATDRFGGKIDGVTCTATVAP